MTDTYEIVAGDAGTTLTNTATGDTAETDPKSIATPVTVDVDPVVDPGPNPRPNPGPGAQNIPVFGPFGLLAILFGLAYFGRRRQK